MKRRQPLADWEKAELALEWLRPMQEGRPKTPLKDLAARYGDRDESTITRAIQAAFREGLVEVRQKRTPLAAATRVRSLEDQLCERFRDRELEVAIVIDPGQQSPDQGRNSDLVHAHFGRAAARLLAQGLLRRGDRVGLGSGRAVYEMCSALQEHPWLSVRDITLISLTGALFPTFHDEQGLGLSGVGLDADFHVALMGTRFSSRVHCLNVAFPIAFGSPEDQDDIRKTTPLDEGRFKRNMPTLAIVGVGVLEGRHRLANLGEEKQPDRILGHLREPLARLLALVQKVRSEEPPWIPVADLANWLFYSPPPDGVEKPSADDEQDIRTLIDELNARLLTVRPSQLSQVDRVLLVAGTRQKARAIHYALTSMELNVRTLVTDMETAKLLLSKEYHRTDS